MDEQAKNKLILILAVTTFIFFILSLASCNTSRRQKNARDKEMSMRLDLEEKMTKFAQEKNQIQQKMNAANQALEEEKTAHQATKKALSQEQAVSQSLKEEVAKVTKLKEALEEDLKEALVSGGKARQKR